MEVEGGGDGRENEDDGIQELHRSRVQVLRPARVFTQVVHRGVPLVGLVVKVEVEDGGDVAQASSQDAKADEGQGVTEMCNIK